MTFKTWINDLRNVQSVINNISNTRVIIDGATGLLNTNSLKEMSSAVSGLSKEQALLVLSTKNLNAAQQEQVLLAAGIISSENNITASAISQALAKTQLSATEKEALLTKLGLIDATTGEAIANATCTKEELLKVLATKGIIGADADAIISSIGLTSANSAQAISFDLLTASIWANIKALGKWLITNPVGWVILGGTAIFGLVKAYDALTDSVEEVQERTDKLLDSYNSAISEANSNAKTIESLADRYGELSKGVNNLGENVSLTSDEYSEYKGIVDQIAEMFPTLITGYTNEGTAILSLKGNVEKLRDAYKEAQTEAYNLLIVSGEDSDGNDIISNYKNQVNGNESWLSKQSSYIDGEGGARDAIDIITKLTGALTPDEFRDTYNELYEQYKNIWNSDKIQEALKSSGFEELSHAPKWGELTSDDLAKVKSTAQATIQTYKAEIDSRLKNVDTLANAYLMTNEDYSKLDEQSQTAASLIVNSITEDIANGFKTKVDVGAYVANIISKIKDNPDLNKSLVDLFREDFSSMSVDEAKNKLDGYINTIAKILNEDPVELKVRLGFDDYDDVEPLKTKVQGFLKDEFDDKVGELSLEDLDVASKLEIPEGTLLTWDELKQKIEEAKNAIPEEAPILFSDLFNNDSIDKTKQKLLDLATSGELSAETITSTEDYKALLDELGISADEFVNKISEFNIQYNEDNYNSLIDLLSRVRKGEILSADEATTLIATYDSLAGELVKTGNGYSFNESAIISLTNKYAETSNLAISNEVKKTNAAIEGVKERINAYGIEMEALKTIQKIYEDTGSKIEVMNWLKDNGYSMFMASNYLDIANEYSELEKKSESLKGKMLEQIETTTSAAKSTETALDRIKNKFQELTDVIGSNVNLILSQIKLLEAQGKEVGSAYYTELVDQSLAKIAVLTEQFNELRKEFLNTPKGTDEWLELNAAILEVQNSIIETKTSMAEYQKTLDNMKWDRAEKTFNALSDTISSNTDLVEAEISKLEASGERVGKVFYAGLIGMVEKNIATLTDRHKTLMEQLTTTEEGSDDWIDLNKSIFDCQKAIIDAQKSLAKYSKTLDGIDWEKYQSIYDASSNVIDNYKETIQAQIDVAEAGGKEVGKAYYEALISASQDDINFNLSRRNELIEQLGTVEEGSEEWSNIRDEIDSVDQAVIKCNVDIAGYQKTLDSIDWERATEKYNTSMDIINANDDLIQSQISQIETAGGTVGKAFYEALISNIETEIGVYSNRLKELQARLLSVDEGSEEWISLNTEILDVQNSILGAKEKIEGFQNSIDSLHWDELDRLEEAINGISNEAGNIVDLLDLDKVLDDNGAFTNDAVTALAMYGEQLETAQYLINKYSKEIEYLNGEYAKGSITTEEYNEKMQDLNDKQWESVDAYNAAKKAIIELRKKGIEEEIDALEDLYDARKKAWEQEKDQHDWEKTVSENETNINKLKAQIAELQNDNSLAGIKKRKELEDELNKAESDWEDTLYDHVYDEHQDQLDKELDDKKKALEKTLDDEEKLVTDSIDLVNQNCSTVLDNLNRLSREYGIQISNSITEGFKGGENALSSYSSKFSKAHSGFTTQLGLTEGKVYDVQKQADSTSKSLLNMFGSTNGTLDEQLDTTTGKIDNAHTEADKAALAFLNMLLTENGTLAEQIDKVKRYVEESYDAADSASLKFWQMLQEKNGTLDAQLDSTKIKIDAMYTSADTASQEIVNMFKSTNGTLGTQLDKVKSTLEAINAEADKAKTALSNIGMNVPAPADSSATGVLGSVTHDNSGTILPDAGTYPNADRDIKNLQTKAEEISKDAPEAARKTDEEKKKKPVLSGGSKTGGSNNKLQISKAYATGTKSATKGWHPMFEEGVEAIEKDGELLVPLSGGEMVFNNEQLRKLWEFSKDPENMAKLSASIYGNMPKFGGNLTPNIPINNTQNVNVQQHFDALVKVEGDMTPDVLAQLTNDRKIVQRVKDIAMEGNVEAYCTRGYRIR